MKTNLGILFGQVIFMEGNEHKEDIIKWLEDADKAKRELDYIKGMSELEKKVSNK